MEILTTCARSHDDDWSLNVHRPGLAVEDGLSVRRFRVERRDRAAYNRADDRLLTTPQSALRIGVSPAGDDDARAFVNEGVRSPALLEYLAANRERYGAFLFMQYLRSTTLQGLPLVAERAFLQPLLHDEAYAYLPAVAAIVHQARGLLFISAGEFELARRLFGPGIVPKSHVVGAGVDPAPLRLTEEPIGAFDPRSERYILYLGRQDPAKNVDQLVDGFHAYRSRRPLSELKLVLAGARGRSHARGGNGVVDLGFVDEPAKEVLLRWARALAQPSRNESYSRVMMEAWLRGRPVIVHDECLATATAMRAAQGGWTARTLADWARVCELVDLADDESLAERGARGRTYALEYGTWERVIARYEEALRAPSKGEENAPAGAVDPRIWDLRPEPQVIAALQDGADNLLFFGPFTEEAHLDQLIEAFLHYLTLVRDARLILLGSGEADHGVYERVVREVESLRLTDSVLVVPDASLALRTAIFRTSHLFWSMAETIRLDEQLQTALWFDIPALAYKGAGGAELAARSGVVFTGKDDLLAVAALAKILVHDSKLRAAIVAKGREQCLWPSVPA